MILKLLSKESNDGDFNPVRLAPACLPIPRSSWTVGRSRRRISLGFDEKKPSPLTTIDPTPVSPAALDALHAQEAGSDDDYDYVDVNERDRDGYAPLHVALSNGQTECAKALVEHGAEWFITLEGSNALHIAVSTAAIPHFAEQSLAAV